MLGAIASGLVLVGCGASAGSSRTEEAAPAAATEPPRPTTVAGPIHALAFAGDTVVTVGSVLAVWDGASLTPRRSRPIEGRPSVHVQGATVLANCSDSRACLFERDSLRILQRYETSEGGEKNDVFGAAMSPDGRFVAARCAYGIEPELGDGGVVATCVWDRASGALVHRRTTEQLYYYAQPFAFRPDSAVLVATCRAGLCLSDTRGAAPQDAGSLAIGDGMRLAIAFDPAGHRLAVIDGESSTIHVFEPVRSTVDLEPLGYGAVTWFPDGRALAVVYEDAIVVYARDGSVLARAPARYDVGSGLDVVVSADGAYLAVEWGDYAAAGFHVVRTSDLHRVAEFAEQSERDVVPVAWHPDRTLLVFGSRSGRLGTWEPGRDPTLVTPR